MEEQEIMGRNIMDEEERNGEEQEKRTGDERVGARSEERWREERLEVTERRE